jgi:hypothetical protein
MMEISNPLYSYEFSRIVEPHLPPNDPRLPVRTPPGCLVTLRHPKASHSQYVSGISSLQASYKKRFDSDLRRKLLFLLLEASTYKRFSTRGQQDTDGGPHLSGK